MISISKILGGKTFEPQAPCKYSKRKSPLRGFFVSGVDDRA